MLQPLSISQLAAGANSIKKLVVGCKNAPDVPSPDIGYPQVCSVDRIDLTLTPRREDGDDRDVTLSPLRPVARAGFYPLLSETR